MAVALSAKAQGSYEAIDNFAVGVGGYVHGTAGWTFRTTSQIAVTALGCFDYVLHVGNQESIAVGLWDSGGELVVSTTVALSSTLLGSTRYEMIVLETLGPNQTFHVGAYNPGGTIFHSAVIPGELGFVTTSPGIEPRGHAFGLGGFVFPEETGGADGVVLLASDFQYIVVPEPSCAFLLGLSALGVFMKRRLNC